MPGYAISIEQVLCGCSIALRSESPKPSNHGIRPRRHRVSAYQRSALGARGAADTVTMLDGRIRNIRPFARCRSIRVAQAHFRIRRSTHASCGDGHLWRTFLAVASLVCSLPAGAVQDETEPALRYRVEVSAPSEVRADKIGRASCRERV